jgi:elongation factor Ts
MMQCKQALTEAGGDMDEAVTILRKKQVVKTEGRSGRTAAEGIVMAAVTDTRRVGVLVELNCETDFVARNDDFRALAQRLARRIAAYGPGTVPTSLEAFLADPFDGTGGGPTVAETITEAAARIGEKVALGRFERFGAPEGNVVGSYVHNPGGSGEDGGKIGVLVEVTGADEAASTTLAREIALHVASANPQYLSEGDVEPAILDKEREIARAQAANDPKMAGKPEKAIESMVNGRVRKFLEKRCS